MEPETKAIMAILLSLPPADRAIVLAEINHNGILCIECGVGERDKPNKDCACHG